MSRNRKHEMNANTPHDPEFETLRSALNRAADALGHQVPPATVERAVFAAFDTRLRAQAKTATRRRPGLFRMGLVAATLCVATVAGLLLWGVTQVTRQATQFASQTVRQTVDAISTGFLPLVSNARLRAEAEKTSTAWVVPAELPRSALANLGLPYDPARAGERMQAEVLLSAQGDVLAVRLVEPIQTAKARTP
jgi:hypothetical protein